MAGSRELYELIGSLSKTEKRYCRMMLETGTGRRASSCLGLFEILSGMPVLDESDVRAAVEGEPFARHLSVTKNHLYEHLLRSLRTFGAARANRSRVHALIEETEVLLERGLLRQARERLREARELAERHDYLPEQIAIERLALSIERNEGYAGVTAAHLRERRERVDALLGTIGNYWDHLHAHSSLAIELLHGGPRTGEPRAGEPRAGEPRAENGTGKASDDLGRTIRELPPPISASARRLHMKIKRDYHLLTARFNDGYEHSLESLRFVESFPLSERIEQFDYDSILFHHVIVSLQTGRMAEARETFERLAALQPKQRSARNHHVLLVLCCRLELLIADFDHEGLAAMGGELEEICGRDSSSLARQLRISYALQLAYAQFVNGCLTDAVRTLHPLINGYRPGFRNDALCGARLYQLMIHYDLGDIELLPYLVRSTYRFITNCRDITGVDRVVLRFMRRLPDVITREDLTAEFRRVREELLAVAGNPAELEASSVCYILPWLDSKITGRPFGELAREARRGGMIGERGGAA